jgi:hypothetical protein
MSQLYETILNIYLVIEEGEVIGFKAKSYERSGEDDSKIEFLKARAKLDYDKAEDFGAPINKKGSFMKYSRFSKLEKHGMHFKLFENIFKQYDTPDNPLICVTPVVDGEILSDQ